ncbi:MAG: hypothetical protein ACW97A_04410 [Candidatus Thorarchaeota archaeon]|jgi:hypothetical protein
MSRKAVETPGFADLREKYRNFDFGEKERVSIISSPLPDAMLASALLCRAVLKVGGLFHISFIDPVCESSHIDAIIKSHSNFSPIITGVDIVGKSRSKKGVNTAILIGSKIVSRNSILTEPVLSRIISSEAYALAIEKLSVSNEELQLAAIGTLIESKLDGSSFSSSQDIQKLAFKEGLLTERKGIKLYGTNFLPLKEALISSIHPYLEGLSGLSKACDRIIEDSRISLSKRTTSFSSLNSKEAKNFTSNLIAMISHKVIGAVLGKDFVIEKEPDNSPLKYISALLALSTTAWSTWELGLLVGIWMGDRARMLRSLVDSHINRSREVISGVQRLSLSLQSTDNEIQSRNSALLVSLDGTTNRALNDIGRILFELDLINREKILVLATDTDVGIIWTSERSLFTVLTALRKKGFSPLSTSQQSVLVSDTSQENVEEIFELASKT